MLYPSEAKVRDGFMEGKEEVGEGRENRTFIYKPGWLCLVANTHGESGLRPAPFQCPFDLLATPASR